MSGLEEAVLRNIEAVSELSEKVRTSFGPNGEYPRFTLSHLFAHSWAPGRNKLIINHLGKLFVTSDAATIIREIEVVHPAAKLLVMASEAQEQEVTISALLNVSELNSYSQMGDATNLVLILAGELLKRAENLLVMGLHPSEVVIGYEMAVEKGRQELEGADCREGCPIFTNSHSMVGIVAKNLDNSVLPSQAELATAIAPSLAAKQPGSERFLSELVAEAALAVMPTSPKDFNVDSVRIVKVLGGGLDHSRVVRGMVFGREAEGMLNRGISRLSADSTFTGIVKKATKAKVAVFSCGMDIGQTETKGTVLLKNANDLLDFSRGEEKQLEGVSTSKLYSDASAHRSIHALPVHQRDCGFRSQGCHRRFRSRRPRSSLPQQNEHCRDQDFVQI